MSGGEGGKEPPDPAAAAKRKAGASPEEARRTPKRQTPTPDPAAAEQRRQELAEVWAAYEALHRSALRRQANEQQQQQGPASTAAASGSASPGSSPASAEEEAAFVRLLQAGSKGSEGCRRLAARLLPRYARHFPQHSSTAADALIGLATLSLSDEPEAQAAARLEAAAGLSEVAAAARASGAAGQQATIRLVDFCFKQLRHVLAAAASAAATNGDLANGGSSSLPSARSGASLSSGASGAAAGGSPPEQHLWACLDLCFSSHFRVVLAACLHSLKNPAEPFYAVARHFLLHRLLAAPGPPSDGTAAPAAAAAAAASAAAEGPAFSGGSPMAIDSDDSGAGDAAAGASAAAQQRRRQQEQGAVSGAAACLAGRVFGTLAPREQAWVRGHVEKWSREVDSAGSQEAFSLLEQLLRLLPLDEGEQAPGWLAASAGLPLVVASPQAPAPAARGAGGAEQQPAAAAAQQQQQQQEGEQAQRQPLSSDRGRRLSRSRSRSLPRSLSYSSRSRTRSPSSEPQLVRRLSSRGGGSAGPSSAHCRRRGGSGSPPPLRRRTPSPWRTTQQRQRSPSPWRTAQRQRSPSPWRTAQRQRSSSPWRRWSPGGDQRDNQPPRRSGRSGGPASPPPKRSRRSMDASGPDDGKTASSPPRAPLPPRMPPGFPQPGPSPCLASACLFFSGLPRGLEERELRAECSKHGKAECAVRPPGLQGCGFVTFKSVRDASRCYEAMCEALPWRERGTPLQLTFVGAEVYPPNTPQRPQRPPNHVWVAGVGSAADEAEVLRCCREGGIPAPEHLLKVPARRPGLLLVFRDAPDAEAAVAAIRAGRPRIMGPPAPAPPGARPGLPPGLGPQAAARAHSGSPPPRAGPRGSGEGRERGGRGERDRERERGEANGRDGGGEGASMPLPPAEFAGRTLWVGQIPPGVREDALLELFRKCGELAGHKFLRHTACMFVDFATLAGAIEARKRLDGYRFGGGCLRVEYKNENQFWGAGHNQLQQAPQLQRDRGGPPPGGRHMQQHPPFRDGPAERGRPLPGSRDRSPAPERGRQRAGSRSPPPEQGRPRPASHSPPAERGRAAALLEHSPLPERRRCGWEPAGPQQQPDPGPRRSSSRERRRGSRGSLEQEPDGRSRDGSRERRPVRGQSPQRPAPVAAAPAAAAEGRPRKRWEERQPEPISNSQGQQPSAARAAQPAAPAAAASAQAAGAAAAAVNAPRAGTAPAPAAPPACPPPGLAPAGSGSLGCSGASGRAAAGPVPGLPPGIRVTPPPTLPPVPSLPSLPQPPVLPPPPGLSPPQAAAAAAGPAGAGGQQGPPASPAGGAGQPTWRGTVAKSRVPVCVAVCSGFAGQRFAGGWASGEPQQWPAVLDVAHRADLQHICSQLFSALRPEERAVLRLAAADASGQQALQDFAQYLRSKSRAGVVTLPALQPAPPARPVQRTLYLVPPSQEVCSQLGAPWEACADGMLALVVPLAPR
ncbi:hypothetical protein ABPG75_003581 [Micractinium tetrahymenae]